MKEIKKIKEIHEAWQNSIDQQKEEESKKLMDTTAIDTDDLYLTKKSRPYAAALYKHLREQ